MAPQPGPRWGGAYRCDKCLGMLEIVGEVFPASKYQRCTVHFYRNVFSVTSRSKVKIVAKMLNPIHAQESKKAARKVTKAVVEELQLKEAAMENVLLLAEFIHAKGFKPICAKLLTLLGCTVTRYLRI